ncbi:hypothetical protein [Flavobacterium branchiicola]|uniref:Uncharacterized protein n=1 Tax=Flavobacterium branchiicola TaxID=1114875 RepID=A0ABV9PGG4_9FLAO|nr:hypothetical protein [Flavobacterium branchiicola]MBS7254947.1 hypothetical protein [Flavobacterium branchiicola]
MVKSILNLEGSHELTINEKKNINSEVYPQEPICGYTAWYTSEIVCLNDPAHYQAV